MAVVHPRGALQAVHPLYMVQAVQGAPKALAQLSQEGHRVFKNVPGAQASAPACAGTKCVCGRLEKGSACESGCACVCVSV